MERKERRHVMSLFSCAKIRNGYGFSIVYIQRAMEVMGMIKANNWKELEKELRKYMVKKI